MIDWGISVRHYVLVGSIFLSGCVAIPVNEVPEEQVIQAQQSAQLDESTAKGVDDNVADEVVAPSQVEPVEVQEQSLQAPVNVAQQATAEVDNQLPQESSKSTPAVEMQLAQGSSTPTAEDSQVAQEAEASAPKVAASVPPQPRKDMQPTNAVQHWLAQADKAFKKDYLTTPASNNAYAYYGRVLLQEPDNRQALAGLEKIVQRYLNLALSSQRKGKQKQAKLFLQRANKVVPSHPDIGLVEKELVRIASTNRTTKSKAKSTSKSVQKRQTPMKFAALQTQKQSVMDAPEGMQRQRILLPPSALQMEAPALAIYLRHLARQIEQVDGRLFIIAPKDKQVRWVYSLLNGTNPDYRIRANMKHKKPAAIEVMYSGEQPILDVFE